MLIDRLDRDKLALQDELGQLRAAVKRWYEAEIRWDLVKWGDTGAEKYRVAGELADAASALRKARGDDR